MPCVVVPNVLLRYPDTLTSLDFVGEITGQPVSIEEIHDFTASIQHMIVLHFRICLFQARHFRGNINAYAYK